jgi:adenosylhomocysteinase
VAAALAKAGISIYAWHGMNVPRNSTGASTSTLEMKPTMTLDDGADLIFRVHDKHQDLIDPRYLRRHRGDHHRRAPPARHGS